MNISYADLENYKEELNSIYSNINSILQNVINLEGRLSMSECWKGNAFEHYNTKIYELSENFNTVYRELEKTTTYLEKILERAASVDSKIIQASKNLTM